MQVVYSVKKISKLISLTCVVSTGILVAGCSDDSTTDPFAVATQPQGTEVPVNPTTQQPVVQQPIVQQPIVQQPVVQEPIVQQPIVQEPIVQEPIVQQPVVQEPIVQQPLIQEPIVQQPIGGGGATIALQRLQPATQYDFTVIADGSMSTEVVDYTNSEFVEDQGDILLVTTGIPGIESEICLFEEDLYLCVRFFDSNGSTSASGGIAAFTLEANNRGTGAFAVCNDIINDPDSCINQFTDGTPAGTMNITAGLQTAFATASFNPIYNGGSYTQYLARSAPSAEIEFQQPSQDLLNSAVERLVQTVNQ